MCNYKSKFNFFQNVRPQMVLSIDNNIYDLRRPFEPPLPTDPEANICRQDSKSTTTSIPSKPKVSEENGLQPLKFRCMTELVCVSPPPMDPNDEAPVILTSSGKI